MKCSRTGILISFIFWGTTPDLLTQRAIWLMPSFIIDCPTDGVSHYSLTPILGQHHWRECLSILIYIYWLHYHIRIEWSIVSRCTLSVTRNLRLGAGCREQPLSAAHQVGGVPRGWDWWGRHTEEGSRGTGWGKARGSVIIGKVQGFGDEKHMFSVWWDEKLSGNYVWAILSKMVIIHMKNTRPHPGSHNWKNWKPKPRSLDSYSRKTDSRENQVNKKKTIFLCENQN